jgi:dienelactone hydrolase
MHTVRLSAWVLALGCLLVLLSATHAQNPADSKPKPAESAPPNNGVVHYIRKGMFIPAPHSLPNGLDAIEVYADFPGKHPLVVLTHGTSIKEEDRRRVTPWAQVWQAMWFAQRGYVAIVVVRRGYGLSGGERDHYYGECHAGGFKDAGNASADDLRAVISYGQSLPEVDPATVVSTGISTGGFAQVALSSNPPPGLRAAINFAGNIGSDGMEHNCDFPDLVDAFGSFGKGARKHGDLPMLWIYAENDHYVTMAMARQLAVAYAKGGGVEQFIAALPDGDDGHNLYGHISMWSDTVAAFLKAHNLLPLGDRVLPPPQPPNIPAPAGLNGQGEQVWKEFLLGPPFKAFAVNGQGSSGFVTAAFDQQIADDEAIDRCKKYAGDAGNCAVVARTPGMK